VELRLIEPDDEDGIAEFAAVLQASDKELWPDLCGYTAVDLRAFARFKGKSRRWELLAAREPGGPTLGVGLMEFPLLENLHSTEITLAVHPAHRRRGVGTAIVEKMEGLRRDELREVVVSARDAELYRISAFVAPWPKGILDDQCDLLRVMSTDEPAGDGERQAEHWDEARVREHDELDAAREVTRLASVAQHVPSGRLVAMTELLIAEDAPGQAWQMITVVHPDHRGHRLGLAIKLANLDLLAEVLPAVRVIITGNAAVNAPMIGVNDMMGFEIISEGAFWQKHLAAPIR